ncbi:LURP-one-related/scramblase family protein [Sporosarcina sp. A2]|uniref:LURP-one-related/scramblase family protein n=1 Tax=Sporosarcina sp. A2 TaxID=3393449 RepID=UPI003D7BF41D
MEELYVKQKMFSMSGKFTVKDIDQKDVYRVAGSFMQVPKTYTIEDSVGHEVAIITKKLFSFLPTFYVDVAGQEQVTIQKQFTFLKARYTIHAAGMEVSGNWWDMDFEVLQHGEVVGRVAKKWFEWGDSYRIQVVKEEMETLMVALVVAIDCVQSDQSAATSVM